MRSDAVRVAHVCALPQPRGSVGVSLKNKLALYSSLYRANNEILHSRNELLRRTNEQLQTSQERFLQLTSIPYLEYVHQRRVQGAIAAKYGFSEKK